MSSWVQPRIPSTRKSSQLSKHDDICIVEPFSWNMHSDFDDISDGFDGCLQPERSTDSRESTQDSNTSTCSSYKGKDLFSLNDKHCERSTNNNKESSSKIMNDIALSRRICYNDDKGPEKAEKLKKSPSFESTYSTIRSLTPRSDVQNTPEDEIENLALSNTAVNHGTVCKGTRRVAITSNRTSSRDCCVLHNSKSFFQPLKVVNQHSLTKCKVVRRRNGLRKFLPVYELYIQHVCPNTYEIREELVMIAKKQARSRSFHVFNVSNGTWNPSGKDRLHKKNGNYVGKIKSSQDRAKVTIYGPAKGVIKTEYGCIDLYVQRAENKSTKKPREVSVILPNLMNDSKFVSPHRVKRDSVGTSLRDKLVSGSEMNTSVSSEVMAYRNTWPTFSNGKYRLNFNGRVQKPSVKNFQLSAKDSRRVILQFGRISKDSFILDFQSPLATFQAFGIAIAQLNF